MEGVHLVGVLAQYTKDIRSLHEEDFPKAVIECQSAIICRDDRSMSSGNEPDADDAGTIQVTLLSAGGDLCEGRWWDKASGCLRVIYVEKLNVSGGVP